MSTIIISKVIAAPVDEVFNTVADINRFSKAIPHIVKIEFLSEITVGVGTRFRETRIMKGRESVTELEVTEYEKNERVRMVADSHGTIWDTVFVVEPDGEHSKLTLTMEARSYQLMPRIMNVVMKGMISGSIARDMDLVKRYCENV